MHTIHVNMTVYVPTKKKSSFLAKKKDNRVFFSIMNSKNLPFLKIHPCFKIPIAEALNHRCLTGI